MRTFPSFDELMLVSKRFNQHYSMPEKKKRIVYDALVTGAVVRMQILEIGVCHGSTAVMLALFAEACEGKYRGVDNFCLEPSIQELINIWRGLGLPLRFYVADSQNVDLLGEWPWVDFLLIDGGHDEVNIKHDCERFLPWVMPGGIVVFDDYDGPDGAHWAVHKYANLHTEDWERFNETDGVLVVKKPWAPKPSLYAPV